MKSIGITTVGVRIDHKDLDAYLLKNAPIEIINKYKKLVTYFYQEAENQKLKLDNDFCVEQNFVLERNQCKENTSNIVKNIIRRFF